MLDYRIQFTIKFLLFPIFSIAFRFYQINSLYFLIWVMPITLCITNTSTNNSVSLLFALSITSKQTGHQTMVHRHSVALAYKPGPVIPILSESQRYRSTNSSLNYIVIICQICTCVIVSSSVWSEKQMESKVTNSGNTYMVKYYVKAM